MLRGPQGPGCAVSVDKVVNVGWGLAMDSSICEDQYFELGSEMDREPVQVGLGLGLGSNHCH